MQRERVVYACMTERIGDVHAAVKISVDGGRPTKRLLVVIDSERLERAQQAYAEAGQGEGDLPGLRLMTPSEYRKFRKQLCLPAI